MSIPIPTFGSIEDIRALPSATVGDFRALPEDGGLYFVVESGSLLYVGQSTRIRKRWYKHKMLEKSSGALVYFWSCGQPLEVGCDRHHDLIAVEGSLIERFNPPFNDENFFKSAWREQKEAMRVLRERESALVYAAMESDVERFWNPGGEDEL